MARAYGYLDGSTPIPSYPEAIFPDPVNGRLLKTSEPDAELQKHLGWVKEHLLAGWQPITIFEELPVRVGRSSFYRFLYRHNLAELGESVRRTIREEIIHASGEVFIIDWGKLRDVVNPDTGKRQTLWMFVDVMGYSRYMIVCLVWSNDVTTTLTTLEEMFREFGGVPERIVSDNPKCFSLKASVYEPLLNPVYERPLWDTYRVPASTLSGVTNKTISKTTCLGIFVIPSLTRNPVLPLDSRFRGNDI